MKQQPWYSFILAGVIALSVIYAMANQPAPMEPIHVEIDQPVTIEAATPQRETATTTTTTPNVVYRNPQAHVDAGSSRQLVGS